MEVSDSHALLSSTKQPKPLYISSRISLVYIESLMCTAMKKSFVEIVFHISSWQNIRSILRSISHIVNSQSRDMGHLNRTHWHYSP